jgi:hypothetical protein
VGRIARAHRALTAGLRQAAARARREGRQQQRQPQPAWAGGWGRHSTGRVAEGGGAPGRVAGATDRCDIPRVVG